MAGMDVNAVGRWYGQWYAHASPNFSRPPCESRIFPRWKWRLIIFPLAGDFEWPPIMKCPEGTGPQENWERRRGGGRQDDGGARFRFRVSGATRRPAVEESTHGGTSADAEASSLGEASSFAEATEDGSEDGMAALTLKATG